MKEVEDKNILHDRIVQKFVGEAKKT